MNYKEYITQLQLAPEPPIVVPIAPYPEKRGEYKGSRFYTTATSGVIVNEFLESFLPFMAQCEDVILAGRENDEVKSLAAKITFEKISSHDKAKAIHNWVYKNIHYQKTPNIVPPWDLARGASGDCKSITALIGALLGVVNIPCWLKLVKLPKVTELHIYDLANLTWGTIDGTGAHCFKEVKPVQGYLIFEIDKTLGWPPMPLPSGYSPYFPPELKEVSTMVVVGSAIGIVGILAFLGVRELRGG